MERLQPEEVGHENSVANDWESTMLAQPYSRRQLLRIRTPESDVDIPASLVCRSLGQKV